MHGNILFSSFFIISKHLREIFKYLCHCIFILYENIYFIYTIFMITKQTFKKLKTIIVLEKVIMFYVSDFSLICYFKHGAGLALYKITGSIKQS